MTLVEERIQESIKTKEMLLQNKEIVYSIQEIAKCIQESVESGGKVLICGNGGSASDALHITGELVGRFQKERQSLPAIALNADVATMTAIANDYGYDVVFAREVEGLMKDNDILIGISTSGNSENIYRALLKAKEIGGKTVAFLGKNGGKIKEIVDYHVIVPSDRTARIQECHIMIGHIICELVEESSICEHRY